MKTSTKFILLCCVVASTAALALRAAYTSPPPVPTEPPPDLIKPIVLGNVAKAYYGDIYRGWFDWETIGKNVIIKRRERENVNSAWFEQVQESSTAYFVVDVRGVCDAPNRLSSLFIAGVYPSGESCIERWSFSYPAPSAVGTPYVPIDQRRLPAIRKSELFRGAQYGHIRSLEPDPDVRFAMFLSYEHPTLYRLSLPSGTIAVELSQATVPQLIKSRSLYAKQHTSEGRQFHVLESTRWEADMEPTQSIIVLKDGNNDAVFDAPITLSLTGWTQAGYDGDGVWLKFCQ